ncbi:MAG: hypothetical protein KDH17_11545 [Rhodocyclaceae bacterium]|nr:hypothetical protein [Rhodocyclaceae bacterium]MCB1928654.1 hypothetical protein [Rhodocyclaceae bacterium]MCP5236567.1 hypothetical protein [Zoogloeaceae bacterium]
MTRILVALSIATLLGGCIVLPLDYGHRGGHGHRHHDGWGDRHHSDGHHRGWGDRDRR